MIPTLAGVAADIFPVQLGRRDPAQVLAGKISNPEQIKRIRKQLGVDRPILRTAVDFCSADIYVQFRKELEHPGGGFPHILTRAGPSLTI
jgi:peptide/nickel transport system permease protein